MSKIKRTHNKRLSKTQEIFYKIVIVCEDSVNSVAYFNAILKDLKLWQAQAVFVDGKSRSAPKDVYEYAFTKYSHIYKLENHHVYCVIDKDSHSCFKDTMLKQELIKNLTIIPSVPCFELWVMLHYKESCSQADRNMLYQELKKNYKFDKDTQDYGVWYNDYAKNHTEIAIERAKKLKTEHEKQPDVQPAYTDVYILVQAIHKMKKE